jgi:Uma2 family endonuclease
MASGATTSKPFKPGTTGWGASDLDDPDVEAKWFQGRFEIVEGVLTEMPAAYFSSSNRLFKLQFRIASHLQSAGIAGEFANEVDIVIDEPRVVRADAVWMTPQDEARQATAVANAPPLATSGAPRDPERTRVLVPPTLIIESLSPGHESHDRRTKRKWYAEFGVPNYWLFDPFARSLECLVLDGNAYRVDQTGHGGETVRPALFPGLVVPLADVWSA